MLFYYTYIRFLSQLPWYCKHYYVLDISDLWEVKRRVLKSAAIGNAGCSFGGNILRAIFTLVIVCNQSRSWTLLIQSNSTDMLVK
jgi:hypothetical protein